MPSSELEYWWSKDQKPEFVLINNEPEPDPEDPTKLAYIEDPLILHTPTGRIINYAEDDEHGIRLFWQPSLEEGEDVDLMNVEFLPLRFDEFCGRGVPEKQENIWTRLVSGVERALNPTFEKLEKWAEEQKDAWESRMKLIEKELELVEAEICLEEVIEEEEELLKMIPSRLQNMFSSWEGSRQTRGSSSKPSHPNPSPSLVNFTQTSIRSLKIEATRQTRYQVKEISKHSLKKLSCPSSSFKSCRELINARQPGYHWSHAYADDDLGKILSLHTFLESGIL